MNMCTDKLDVTHATRSEWPEQKVVNTPKRNQQQKIVEQECESHCYHVIGYTQMCSKTTWWQLFFDVCQYVCLFSSDFILSRILLLLFPGRFFFFFCSVLWPFFVDVFVGGIDRVFPLVIWVAVRRAINRVLLFIFACR